MMEDPLYTARENVRRSRAKGRLESMRSTIEATTDGLNRINEATTRHLDPASVMMSQRDHQAIMAIIGKVPPVRPLESLPKPRPVLPTLSQEVRQQVGLDALRRRAMKRARKVGK